MHTKYYHYFLRFIKMASIRPSMQRIAKSPGQPRVVPRTTSIHGWVISQNTRRAVLRRAENSDDIVEKNAVEDMKNVEEAADSIAIEEQMLKKRRKKKKTSEEKPYKVVSAARDSVYGDGPQSSMQQFETGFVQVLGILFFLILAEGIFLGASGFLSEEADQFGQDVIYPLFSPTLGVFLAGSTAYGLWKTKEDDSKKNE
jgi:hypothetical protein